MNNKTHSRTSIFLMELIISVLLFSITSAVCIQLFVNAHIKDRETRSLTHAVIECESVAEIVKAKVNDTPEELFDYLLTIHEFADVKSDSMTLYFDKDFKPCHPGLRSYDLIVKVAYNADNIMTTELSFIDSESVETIYALTVERRTCHE